MSVLVHCPTRQGEPPSSNSLIAPQKESKPPENKHTQSQS